MGQEYAELDRLQNAYQAAVDALIKAIQDERQLASVHHTVAQVDTWENAHFLAEDARREAEAAKAEYEGALRAWFFDID